MPAARVILEPFANEGDRYNIPDSSDTDGVSIKKGFPPIYATPISKGGRPPTREEFNGIFNIIFQHLYDRQIGLIPLYDNRLNYERYCSIRINDGTTYLCLKENGPDTEFGIRNPIDNPEFWSGGSGNSIESLYKDLTALQRVVNRHIGDNNNPHDVSKSQIGLGKIPNNVSNSIDLDDPNCLATSKAVHDLNEAILRNLLGDEYKPGMELPSFSDYFSIIEGLRNHKLSTDTDGNLLLDGKIITSSGSANRDEIIEGLDGHKLGISEDGKLLLDGNNVCNCNGIIIPPEDKIKKQATFTNINLSDPNFDNEVESMNLANGAMFTLTTEKPSSYYEKDGIRSTGFVRGTPGTYEFNTNINKSNFVNGAIFTNVDEMMDDEPNKEDTYTTFIEVDVNDDQIDNIVNNLNVANGAMFTLIPN